MSNLHSNKKARTHTGRKVTALDRRVTNDHGAFFAQESIEPVEVIEGVDQESNFIPDTMDVYDECSSQIKRYKDVPESIKLIQQRGLSVVTEPLWERLSKGNGTIVQEPQTYGFKEIVSVIGDNVKDVSDSDSFDDDSDIDVLIPEAVKWNMVPLNKNIDSMYFIDKTEQNALRNTISDIDIRMEPLLRRESKTRKKWDQTLFSIVGKINNVPEIIVDIKHLRFTVRYYTMKNYNKFMILCLLPEKGSDTKYKLVHYLYLNPTK